MPTPYLKVNGAWVPAVRPYVKRSGVWTPVREGYVKDAGVYKTFYKYDNTPPHPPELTMQIIDERYFRIGARIPTDQGADQVKEIRVLVSRTAYPSGPLGSGFVAKPSTVYPNEPWSSFFYNHADGNSDHGPVTDYDFKEYPPQASAATNIASGPYYFSAWSQDFDGNWSSVVNHEVTMPKAGVNARNIIIKEANFQVKEAGSTGQDGLTYVQGDVTARDAPRSNGVWFHGNQFSSSIGFQGNPTVKGARIRIARAGNDGGQNVANVRLFHHNTYEFVSPFQDFDDATIVGTLTRGETKWFDIPEAWWPLLNKQIRGFGLRFGSNASDTITALGQSDYIRCGEVNVVWEEAL